MPPGFLFPSWLLDGKKGWCQKCSWEGSWCFPLFFRRLLLINRCVRRACRWASCRDLVACSICKVDSAASDALGGAVMQTISSLSHWSLHSNNFCPFSNWIYSCTYYSSVVPLHLWFDSSNRTSWETNALSALKCHSLWAYLFERSQLVLQARHGHQAPLIWRFGHNTSKKSKKYACVSRQIVIHTSSFMERSLKGGLCRSLCYQGARQHLDLRPKIPSGRIYSWALSVVFQDV